MQAKQHKCSLNQEAIFCLEQAVTTTMDRPSLMTPPPPLSVGELLVPYSTRAEMVENFFDRDPV